MIILNESIVSIANIIWLELLVNNFTKIISSIPLRRSDYVKHVITIKMVWIDVTYYKYFNYTSCFFICMFSFDVTGPSKLYIFECVYCIYIILVDKWQSSWVIIAGFYHNVILIFTSWLIVQSHIRRHIRTSIIAIF